MSYVRFFIYCSANHRHLHSFPTRRSSDLSSRINKRQFCASAPAISTSCCCPTPNWCAGVEGSSSCSPTRASASRSEEHTSELQSQFHLVCRLLLEKKKQRSRLNARHRQTA